MDPTLHDLAEKISRLSIQVATLQADVAWLKKFVWGVVIASGVLSWAGSYFGNRRRSNDGGS